MSLLGKALAPSPANSWRSEGQRVRGKAGGRFSPSSSVWVPGIKGRFPGWCGNDYPPHLPLPPLSHHTDQGWPLNWRWRLFLFVRLFIVYLFGRGTREPHCTMGVGGHLTGVSSSYPVWGLHLGHCALWQATETFHLPKEDVWVCLFVCFLMA